MSAALDQLLASGSWMALIAVKATVLPAGTFDEYTERQRRAGVDPARLQPPHVNASEKTLNALLAVVQERVAVS